VDALGPLIFNTPPSPPPSQAENAKSKARPVAIASLVASVAWIAGIGSVLGIVLGFIELRKVKEGSNLRPGSRPAIAGIVLGIVGLVPAAIMWSGGLTNNATNANLSSPSYIDGRTFASQNFFNTARESSVCTAANAYSQRDDVTRWMQGCHDGWAIALSSLTDFNRPGFP
jgi:hypothetical protein